jgi:ribosome assembly protein RRB1
MSKRTATELQAASISEEHSGKRPFRAEAKNVPEEMGEFEDGWEDEYESDEEVADDEAKDGE